MRLAVLLLFLSFGSSYGQSAYDDSLKQVIGKRIAENEQYILDRCETIFMLAEIDSSWEDLAQRCDTLIAVFNMQLPDMELIIRPRKSNSP